MIISINNVAASTHIFIAILLVVFLALIVKKKAKEFFPNLVSQELKGLAILAIVFSHIGYFLSADQSFLFPLSIMAGVGVNIFLLLSGFGVTMSALHKHLTLKQFYYRRLPKLFVPFWLVIGVFFLTDYLFLNKSYSSDYVINSILGLFLSADAFADLNSPLWYFTFIMFYYLIFPLVFRKKHFWLSALVVYAISFAIVKYESGYFPNVIHLYKVHLLAFPSGMILAGLYYNREKLGRVRDDTKKHLSKSVVSYLLLTGLIFVAAYFAYHSNVGGSPIREELTSLLVTFAFLGIFLIKKVDLKLLSLFGVYSYEIYLLHWPILFRYDIFYKATPAWLATILYLALFIFLGRLLKRAAKIISVDLFESKISVKK